MSLTVPAKLKLDNKVLLRFDQNSLATIYKSEENNLHISPTLKSRREDGNSFEEFTFKSSQNGDERNQTKQIKSNV